MKSWSEIETQTSWLQIQPFPLLSWITKSGVFAGEGEFTRGCTAAGQECSKLSFVRKFIFFKVETLGQRWLVLRRFFSWLFPRSESPTLSSEWQRAPTRAAPAPASLLSFFHWKILKVSFLPDTEWKTPLEMSGVFHKWPFLFPDWLWTTGSYTLFASPQPSWCCLLRIATFCPSWLIWSWSIWGTAVLQFLALFANAEFALMQLIQHLDMGAWTPPCSPKSSTDEKKRQHKTARESSQSSSHLSANSLHCTNFGFDSFP